MPNGGYRGSVCTERAPLCNNKHGQTPCNARAPHLQLTPGDIGHLFMLRLYFGCPIIGNGFRNGWLSLLFKLIVMSVRQMLPQGCRHAICRTDMTINLKKRLSFTHIARPPQQHLPDGQAFFSIHSFTIAISVLQICFHNWDLISV